MDTAVHVQSRRCESWSLVGALWVIRVEPAAGESTLLQAEMSGGHYVLCFTSDEKAQSAIATLNMARAYPVCVPGGQSVELVSAMCQVGAVGIIVDLDPQTRRCAWSKQLVAAA